MLLNLISELSIFKTFKTVADNINNHEEAVASLLSQRFLKPLAQLCQSM